MLDTTFHREILRGQNHETRTKRRNIPTVGIWPLTGATNMTYSSFAVAVLTKGATFACQTAEVRGIAGDTMAKWLSRLNTRRTAAQQVAA